ncbi:hypothetical protein [Rhabdothermincola sp.]|uniref:hypothetical protein n=1 Tax=Rhabdothermincola sp. TaxID=2820405 RepID=UPI002FDF3F36
MKIAVNVAVEGPTDRAVAERLLAVVGTSAARVFTVSKPEIINRLQGYNQSAQQTPWYVQVDLDDILCAPEARSLWLPEPAKYLCLAIAVREVEAWLLADRDRLATFLSCDRGDVPPYPDEVSDAKEAMLRAARASKKSTTRERLLPRPGAGRRVGPEYATELIRFATTMWRPEVARQHSPSLDRAITRLDELVSRWQEGER